MRSSYVNLTASDGQTSNGALGEEYNTKGATWIYIKAAAALAAYQLCYIADDGTAALATPTLITTTKPTTLCIPQFAFASGDYGWAAVGPFFLREDESTNFKVLSKAATKDLGMYAVAATPGSVDDAVVAPLIQGLTLIATQTVDDTATACVAHRRLSANCGAAFGS